MSIPYWPQDFDWIIPNKIAGMAAPESEKNILALAAGNVGLIVTLRETPLPYKGEDLFGDNYQVLSTCTPRQAPKMIHIPIVDFSIPTIDQIEYFVQEVRKCLANKQAVVVHCFAGLGRTGLMIACALLATSGISSDLAIAIVRNERPNSICTAEQEQIVHDYHKYVYPLAH